MCSDGWVEAVRLDSRRAWVAAVAVALANGTAFGTAYTFGTFFDSMATEFGANRGSTAIIFGITLLFFFGFGVISGPLSDRVGAHRLLALGGTIFVVGLLATSRVHNLYLGYLTYGTGVGLGSGLFTAPLTATVGRLFVRRRTVALGVVAAGNGCGTLLLVPLSQRLIRDHGWRTAYVTLAVIGAVVFTLAVPAVRVPMVAGQTAAASVIDRLLASLSLLRDRFFATMFGATTLMSVGLFIAFGFIVTFAKDQGVASDRASQLMSIVGLASIGGRLLLTAVSGRLGAVRMFQLALGIQPFAYVVWLLAGGDYRLLLVFVVTLGASYGGFVAIGPEVLIARYGTDGLGTRLGVNFLSYGVGGLIGPPLAGWVADATNGRVVPICLVIVLVTIAFGLSTRLDASRPDARRT